MMMLKAGFGRTDVTPELGVRLGGYGVEERPAEEILDHLHATAMVLQQGELLVAVINLDWICIEEDIVERIRIGVNSGTAIPKENITVCATHSHSVPNTLNFWGWGERENEYINAVLPEIIKSVEIAFENLEEVETGFATTESLTGVNRRSIHVDGGIGMAGDPNGSFDPTMTVAHFKNESGSAGILVHYGAHGTAMGCNRLVSRDWMGIMKDRVEPQFDAPIVFLNGAIGDVGPRTNRLVDGGLSAGTGDGVESVKEVGYRAATDAIRALLSIKEWRSELKLNVIVENITIPYAPLMPLEEAEVELLKWEPRKDEWGKSMCEYMHYKAVVEAYREPILESREFTQTIIVLGPLAIVPMPGEMFSGISLRIRKGSPYQYTLCCSVTNGSLSYLPTREARHRGGYECWVGKAANAYLLADNIDDALVEQNANLLRKIPL
jgi:Neutral/alkaline non-lysosomal ceramidase, N-terminal